MKWLLSTVLILFFAAGLSQSNNKYKVIAYYTGDGETIRNYPVNKLTHIIYSFLGLKKDTLTFKNDEQEETLKQLVALKSQNPQLKIMISIGGWSGCAPCSDLFASAESREIFAKTTLALFKKYQIDGIDLDWEYPAIEGYPGHKYTRNDKDNFTELIRELRKELGGNYLISFAAGGFTHYLEESVDWNTVVPLVDFINLMTYDLTSGYSKITGHHTPLFNNAYQKQSTGNCVSWLLQHRVSSEKLIIGAAYYARVWEEVPDTNRGLNQPGIFKQSISYRQFDSYFTDTAGFKYYFDKKAKAPFYYNSRKKLFATFDDPRSIKLKCNYVQREKLGGIMFWELTLDKTQNGLTDLIIKSLDQ